MDIKGLIDCIKTDWKNVLIDLVIPYEKQINDFINSELEIYKDNLEILPPQHVIFNAFNQFNIEDLKVVIIGQDVYPTKGDGMGLCFSVSQPSLSEVKRCPPSLRNIFKELEAEYGIKRINTDLTDWANQGVLMLNTALTVREGCAGSHIKIWKNFTRDIIKYIANNNKQIVYILWGEHAISYANMINEKENCILTHSHPSPLARKSFVGCNHFTKCNDMLSLYNKTQIKWV